MATLPEALLAVAKAQQAEVAVILRQEKAARERAASLEKLAAAFRAVAELWNDPGHRAQYELYAKQSEREAHAAFLQARVHDSEAKRADMQARTTLDRAAAARARDKAELRTARNEATSARSPRRATLRRARSGGR